MSDSKRPGSRRMPSRILLAWRACFVALLVAGGCSHSSEPVRDVNTVHRVYGVVRDSAGQQPLEHVAVTCIDTIPFSMGTSDSTVSDSTGYYWVRIDFWVHGSLLFEKEGYHPRMFEAADAPTQVNDFDHQLNVLLSAR